MLLTWAGATFSEAFLVPSPVKIFNCCNSDRATAVVCVRYVTGTAVRLFRSLARLGDRA